jgi:hypothetical protein
MNIVSCFNEINPPSHYFLSITLLPQAVNPGPLTLPRQALYYLITPQFYFSYFSNRVSFMLSLA